MLVSPVLSQTLVDRGGWVSAYYPDWGWNHADLVSEANKGVWTHILLVSGSPSNGSVSWFANGEEMCADADTVLGNRGIKKIFQLCCNWTNSVDAGSMQGFITNLLDVLDLYNMDGIDIDWEPIGSRFPLFVHALYDSMTNRYGEGVKEIVCYVNPDPTYVVQSSTYQYLDQINIQGYDLIASIWSACNGVGNDFYAVYHQGALYNGTDLCPLGDNMINLRDLSQGFIDAGVPASKIGMSVRFNSNVWLGGTGTSTGGAALPMQTWSSAPSQWNDIPAYGWASQVGGQSNLDAATKVYDAAHGASYLTRDAAGSSGDFFISYDDGNVCGQKMRFVVDSGYGGVYIWYAQGDNNNYYGGEAGEQVDSLYVYSREYDPSAGEPSTAVLRAPFRIR